MDTNSLSPKVAATLAATPQAKNHTLRTYPKRMALSKVWDSVLRGARKCCEEPGYVPIHRLHQLVRVTGACENTGLVNHTKLFK